MKKKLIELFDLFGYEFKEENPKGRLLFWDMRDGETNDEVIQLWFDNDPDMLKTAAKLITDRQIDDSYKKGKFDLQTELKKQLGL